MSDPLPQELRDRLDALFRSDRHAAELGISLHEWDLGSARVGCTVGSEHTNFVGTAHGGVLFSLADIAMGFASNSEGRINLALHIDINFVVAVHPGDELTAVATVTNRSRRFSHLDMQVTSAGAVVAAATGITYRTAKWHFGEDAWPTAWREAH